MGEVYKFVLDILGNYDNKNADILEIGCGAMQYRDFIKGRHYGLDIVAPESAGIARRLICSAEEIREKDNSFDIVFGVATFLVIPDVVRAFSECHRVLKPNGKLIIFDYNKHVCRRLQRADPGHKHVWNYKQMKGLLIKGGFREQEIKRIDYHNGISRDQDISPHFFDLDRIVMLLKRIRGTWLIVEAAK